MTEKALDPAAASGSPAGSGPPTRTPGSAPPGRGPLIRLGVGLVVVLGVLSGPTAMVIGPGWWQPFDRAAWTTPQSGAGGSVAVSPSSGHRLRSRPADVGARLQAMLDAQAAALLRGDQKAFLAPVDPTRPGLLDELRRRFNTLRAMKIAGWSEQLDGAPEPVDGGWRATVRMGYCFVVSGCEQVTVPVPMRWVDDGGPLRLVELGSSGASDLGPRPWEVSDLRVVVGPRVVVAAPPRYAVRLPALLAAAEQAAAVADRYARWAPRPDRYLVYFAGPDEWGRWYGVRQAQWVAGYAMPITARETEIVLNGQRVTPDEVVDTLRHEFTHVVTLADVHRDYSDQWWLVEGIAEYVRMVGRPLREYELLSASRRYVHAGNRTDVPALTEPTTSASTEDASGRYGVAFLSVRWLAERFGEEKMLRFFDRVVRQGAPTRSAAADVFGIDWGEITGDCAAYVRQNLN